MAFWNRFFKKEKTQSTVEQVEEKPTHNLEIQDILNRFYTSKEDLQLYEIQDNAEIVHTYLKYLSRDLGQYVNSKTGQKKENIKKRIGARIRMVTSHGLELKNLLGHLENHYYQASIETLESVYDISNRDKEVRDKLDELREGLDRLRELDILLTRIIGYEALFNPEKNQEFEQDVEKEVEKNDILKELQDLTKQIQKEILNKEGIFVKIDTHIMEPFKQKF